MTLVPGDTVSVRMTKWGGSPHWAFDALWLGNDDHGDWLGIPAGTVMVRPGARYVAPVAQVGLVPPRDWPDADRGWLATFHAPGGQVLVYVDVTVPPTWSGSTLAACDLDLDVVRALDETVFVDDEDEFALHRMSLGYPAAVVEAARASADRLVALLRAGHPPYDGTPGRWFDLLAALLRD